jgi:hypothetical protein
VGAAAAKDPDAVAPLPAQRYGRYILIDRLGAVC